jgi:hypothetical protein
LPKAAINDVEVLIHGWSVTNQILIIIINGDDE